MKIIATINRSSIKGLSGIHTQIEVFQDRGDGLHYREVIEPSIFKSSFDAIWEGIGEKIKQGLLKGEI